MNKKWFYGVIILFVLVVFILSKLFLGSKPLETITTNDIQSVTVEVVPLEEISVLSEAEIETLVPLLNDVVVYGKDDSYEEYSGQDVIFVIKRKNGLETTIHANNPFLVIDDIGYKAKYTTCEKLSQFANHL